MKYKVIYLSGIPTGVGVEKKVNGGTYSEKICECFLPPDDMDEKEKQEFIKKEKANMEIIANALNAYKPNK